MDTVLRQERQRNGWTLEYVAKEVSVTKSTLQRIETGNRKPSYEVLVKLLDLFGYSDPRELFSEASDLSISFKA